MIQLRNVTKRYRGSERLNAIHELSLVVKKGEFVFIVGSSGAGKSTLLKLISMEEFPTDGEVRVGPFSSRTVTDEEMPFLRRHIGVVYQDVRLWRDWTIGEDVAAAVRVCGVFDAKTIRFRTQDVLHKVGLAHRSRNYPRELSGGEAQRVAIARALVSDPLVLLADEPTGNLDPETSVAIFSLLHDIHATGTPVIVATHDPLVVDRIGGRVVELDAGRQVTDRIVHVAS